MLKSKLASLSWVLILGVPLNAVASEPLSAPESILTFYKTYLNSRYFNHPDKPHPSIEMSRSFREEIQKTEAACNLINVPCNWATYGDEYIDTVSADTDLDFESSGITAKEISPGYVQVKLNVRPSDKDGIAYNERKITYWMIKERGKWVVDDIIYSDNVSSRRKMDLIRAGLSGHRSIVASLR